MLSRSAVLALALFLPAFRPGPGWGAPGSAEPKCHRTANLVKFAAGASIAPAAHEPGHLVPDFACDAKPRLKRVALAGV